jgi:hypothetical protein
VVFREEFFLKSPNALATLLPEYAYLEEVLKVVDLDQAAPGLRLDVVMDGEQDAAVGYLTEAASPGETKG